MFADPDLANCIESTAKARVIIIRKLCETFDPHDTGGPPNRPQKPSLTLLGQPAFFTFGKQPAFPQLKDKSE